MRYILLFLVGTALLLIPVAVSAGMFAPGGMRSTRDPKPQPPSPRARELMDCAKSTDADAFGSQCLGSDGLYLKDRDDVLDYLYKRARDRDYSGHVTLLLAYGGPPKLAPALREGVPAGIIRLLVEHGAPVKPANPLLVRWKLSDDSAETLRILLQAGADPDGTDNDAWPQYPLHAFLAGETTLTGTIPVPVELIELLLDAGASLNRVNRQNMTPLDVAASTGREDLCRLLLERGADPCAVCPLARSVTGPPSLTELLIEALRTKGGRAGTGSEPVREQIQNQLQEALFAAARRGTLAHVDVLLAAGARPDGRDASGRGALDYAQGRTTALVFSSGEGKKIAERLEQAGAHSSEAYWNRLTEQAVSGDATGLERLLAEEPRALTRQAIATALDAALDASVKRDRADVVRLLLAAGTALEPPLSLSTERPLRAGAPAAVLRVFLEAGAPVSYGEKRLDPLFDVNFDSPHAPDLIRELVGRGSDPNAARLEGRIVHEAVRKAPVAAVRTLLDAGANPETHTVAGASALAVSIDEERRDVFELLLDQGAAVTGGRVLDYAAAAPPVFMERLLGVKSRIARSQEGSAALVKAADKGHPATVRLLLDAGADPNARDAKGRSAMQRARDRKDWLVMASNDGKAIAAMLLEAGAKE